MKKVNCIFIDKEGKTELWQGKEVIFEEDIYNNSGIVKPEVVGFIRYFIMEDYVEMRQIFVHPDFREKGLGTQLIKELMAVTRSEGKNKIQVVAGATDTDIFGQFLLGMKFKRIKPKIWELSCPPKITFDSIWQKVQTYIEMNREEGRKLFVIASRFGENAVAVEIGTYRGGSAEIIAAALDGMVYTIDKTPQNYANFFENIQFIQGDSKEISETFDKEIDMLFIDGSHEYEEVQKDIASWTPKVKEGGRICFHDFGSHPGVTRAVIEALEKRIGIPNHSLLTIIK